MWSRAYASPDRRSIFVVAYRSASWSFHALPQAQKRCLCGTSIGRASRLWVNMGEERYDRSLAVNPSDYVRHHTFAFRCTFSEHCSHGDRLTVVNDSMGAVGSVPASDTSLGRFVVEAPWAPASSIDCPPRRPAAPLPSSGLRAGATAPRAAQRRRSHRRPWCAVAVRGNPQTSASATLPRAAARARSGRSACRSAGMACCARRARCRACW